MPDERHLQSVNDPLDQSRIDRELTELLSIAPSPEFAARVRQRIRDERAPHLVRWRWWIGLAVPAAIVLVVMATSRSWQVAEAPRQLRAAVDTTLPSEATPAPGRPAGVPARHTAGSVAQRPHLTSVTAARRQAATPQPEVLVSRDQLRAIARFREMIVSGELTEKNLPPAGNAPDTLTEISLPPLVIAPLILPSVETVVGGHSER